jgi:hypothetical protein
MYSAGYSCTSFSKREISLQILVEMPSVEFNEYPSSGSRVITCGRTGMTQPLELRALLNFAVARKTARSAHTVYLCVLCGSENKQRSFPYSTLTD